MMEQFIPLSNQQEYLGINKPIAIRKIVTHKKFRFSEMSQEYEFYNQTYGVTAANPYVDINYDQLAYKYWTFTFKSDFMCDSEKTNVLKENSDERLHRHSMLELLLDLFGWLEIGFIHVQIRLFLRMRRKWRICTCIKLISISWTNFISCLVHTAQCTV